MISTILECLLTQTFQNRMNNELKKTELGAALTKIDPELVSNFNKEERSRLAKALGSIESSFALSVRQETRHSGPLPSPEMLSHCNEIIPNGAERIMAMAEAQSAHRKELEKMVVTSQTKSSERGQWFAAILAILLIGAGTWAFHTEHDGVAGTIFGVTVTGLVTVFLVGKSKQTKELKEKSEH